MPSQSTSFQYCLLSSDDIGCPDFGTSVDMINKQLQVGMGVAAIFGEMEEWSCLRRRRQCWRSLAQIFALSGSSELIPPIYSLVIIAILCPRLKSSRFLMSFAVSRQLSWEEQRRPFLNFKIRLLLSKYLRTTSPAIQGLRESREKAAYITC